MNREELMFNHIALSNLWSFFSRDKKYKKRKEKKIIVWCNVELNESWKIFKDLVEIQWILFTKKFKLNEINGEWWWYIWKIIIPLHKINNIFVILKFHICETVRINKN